MNGDSFRRLQGKVNGWYISSTPWDQSTGRVSAIYKKYNACIDLYDNVVNAEALVICISFIISFNYNAVDIAINL